MLDYLYRWIYNHLKTISIILLATSLGLLGYYLLKAMLGIDSMYPVGNNMIDTEIVIIPHILYMKPITIIVILGYSGLITGLFHLDKKWGYELETHKCIILEIITFIIFFITLYEVFFNFTLWSGLIASISLNGEVLGNIDQLVNKFPNPNQPWNLVFATKIFYALTLASGTILVFLDRWRRSRENR